jgi:NTE family protein
VTRRALVLGAGGNAAYAWGIGFIVGMFDAGLDVRNADLFIGTSAGSRVAVKLASGLPLQPFFQLLTVPIEQAVKPAPSADMKQLRASVASAKQAGSEPAEILKCVGRIALSTPPASGSARFRSMRLESYSV